MGSVKTMVQAIDVLIQAATLAQKAGIFSLEEARIVADAIDVILGTQDNSQDNIEDESLTEGEGTYQPELNVVEEVVSTVDNTKFVDDTKPKPRTEADIATFKRT